ncbi:unnamed protein product [Cyprideis torosa]|uniref:Uncharacterized protein n=1 Tax=Cyprideis torosa TaxID=163714 RepID=A0A7R8ZUS8_9CRUS|nr:unnamed protein product [Cyprideis torosa]CAG0900904.1 unnamed protein product [Cyprideis torosa]
MLEEEAGMFEEGERQGKDMRTDLEDGGRKKATDQGQVEVMDLLETHGEVDSTDPNIWVFQVDDLRQEVADSFLSEFERFLEERQDNSSGDVEVEVERLKRELKASQGALELRQWESLPEAANLHRPGFKNKTSERLFPKTIIMLEPEDWGTCLCIVCTNPRLKVQALKKLGPIDPIFENPQEADVSEVSAFLESSASSAGSKMLLSIGSRIPLFLVLLSIKMHWSRRLFAFILVIYLFTSAVGRNSAENEENDKDTVIIKIRRAQKTAAEGADGQAAGAAEEFQRSQDGNEDVLKTEGNDDAEREQRERDDQEKEIQEEKKEEAQEDRKDETQEEMEEETQEERKQETQEQRKEKAQEEEKQEAQEEKKQEAQEEKKQEAQEEKKQEAQEEKKQEAQEDKKQEAQEEKKQEAQEEKKQEAQEEKKQEAQEKKKQEAQEEKKQEAQEEKKQEAQEEKKQEAQEEKKQEAQEEKKQEAQEEKKQEAHEKKKQEAQEKVQETQEKKQETQEKKQEAQEKKKKTDTQEQRKEEAQDKKNEKQEEQKDSSQAGAADSKKLEMGQQIEKERADQPPGRNDQKDTKTREKQGAKEQVATGKVQGAGTQGKEGTVEAKRTEEGIEKVEESQQKSNQREVRDQKKSDQREVRDQEKSDQREVRDQKKSIQKEVRDQEKSDQREVRDQEKSDQREVRDQKKSDQREVRDQKKSDQREVRDQKKSDQREVRDQEKGIHHQEKEMRDQEKDSEAEQTERKIDELVERLDQCVRRGHKDHLADCLKMSDEDAAIAERYLNCLERRGRPTEERRIECLSRSKKQILSARQEVADNLFIEMSAPMSPIYRLDHLGRHRTLTGRLQNVRSDQPTTDSLVRRYRHLLMDLVQRQKKKYEQDADDADFTIVAVSGVILLGITTMMTTIAVSTNLRRRLLQEAQFQRYHKVFGVGGPHLSLESGWDASASSDVRLGLREADPSSSDMGDAGGHRRRSKRPSSSKDPSGTIRGANALNWTLGQARHGPYSRMESTGEEFFF